jgi:two-component system, OmpR family, response regulator ChvI
LVTFWNNSDANNHKEEDLSFVASGNYCVLIVDMVNSTKTASTIRDSLSLRRYYSMFFSKVFPIARNYGAKIIKITGDGFICYFPKTLDIENSDAFRAVIECGLAMTNARCMLNSELNSMKLPSTTYRVSADYGNLQIARSTTSRVEDLFGSTMNVCAKINRFAVSNGMVIGGDLYRIVKSFGMDASTHFEELGAFDLGLRNSYPVYAVVAKAIPAVRGPSSAPSSSSPIHTLSSQQPSTAHFTLSSEASLIKPGKSSGNNSNYTNNLPNPRLANNDDEEGGSTSSDTLHDSRLNLMIVDDEPDILIVYKEMLNSERYNPELFVDPMQALKRYAEVEPEYYDLVILDIRMPVMNGLQLYRQMRSVNPNVKVLFITALDAAEELCSAMSGELSPINIIRKPLRVDKLLNKIESYFSLQSLT